ncbi:MAG: hypothetical protein SGI72_09560 [Planctomycetota bacterium]|nr:hypothetical protein [Planctomycetota bacterium]
MLQRFVFALSLTLAACSGGGTESVAPADSALDTVLPTAPEFAVDIADTNDLLRGPGGTGESLTDDQDHLDFSTLTPAQVAAIIASPTPRYRYRAIPGYPGLLEFAVFNTGSGWEERFLLQTPIPAPTGPRPLVVAFHKYGSSHGDLLNTGFIPEAIARGWYLVCPLGARQSHFGNFESQINTRVALNLVRQLCPIDPLRVYAVGFSMGGGSAANYAARHVDPKGVMFAAVCDHTGGVALGHTWWSEFDDGDLDDNTPNFGDNLEVPDVLESMYGGNPTTQPFEYQRCSSIDLDPFTGLIGTETDFARNLAHMPTLVWRAASDPTAFLVTQTDQFDAHIQTFNAGNQYQLAPGTVHAWSTLDANYVCNWFSTRTLSLPTASRTIADEDGNWFYFFVEQDAGGAFTPFTWSVDAGLKKVTVSATKNLKRLKITPAGFGLVLSGAVTLELSTADASGDRFQFLYVPNAPLSVTRDGVPASGTWNATARTFEVVETNAALHTWVLTFP